MYRSFLVIALLFAVSCSKPVPLTLEERVRPKILEWNQRNLKDPSSYEEISLELRDSMTFRESFAARKEFIQGLMGEDSSKIKMYSSFSSPLNGMAEIYIESLQNKALKIQELGEAEKRNSEILDSIAVYLFAIEYRAKNGFGGYDLFSGYVQATGDSLNVIVIGEQDEMHISPRIEQFLNLDK